MPLPATRRLRAILFSATRLHLSLSGAGTAARFAPSRATAATAAALAAALLAAPAQAAGDTDWRRLGPDGGTLSVVATSPAAVGTAYAAALDGSIYATADGGNSWSRAGGLGLQQTNDRIIQFLLLDTTDARHLYAVTGTGIWQSRDGAATWSATPLQDDNATYQFLGAAISNSAPQILYASDPNAGVWRSGDGGATWAVANGGLPWSPPFFGVQALAVDPTDPDTVYLGSFQGMTFKTTDGGISWAPLTALPYGTAVLDLTIDPTYRQRLYAGTSGGIFASADGGITWTFAQPSTASDLRFPSLSVDPTTGSVYAAALIGVNLFSLGGGVYRSLDFGVTWDLVTDPAGCTAVAVDPLQPARVYAVSGLGVERSGDAGATWAAADSGIDQVQVVSAAADAHTPGTLYAALQGFELLNLGLVRSRDGGASWQAINTGLSVFITDLPTYQVIVDPQRPGAVYAVTAGGLFASVDGGDHWRLRHRGLPADFTPYDLAIEPAGAGGALDVAGSYEAIVCDSSDNCSEQAVFLLARSVDAGVTWAPLGTGIPDGQIWTSVAVDLAHPGTLYAESFDLWKSTDSGATWSDVGPAAPLAEIGAGLFELGSSRRLRVDPSFPAILYESSAGLRQLYRSHDAGRTHQRAIAGIPPGSRVRDLVLDPFVSSTLYIATGDGALVSTDRGKLWQPLVASSQPALGRLAADPFTPGVIYGAGPHGLYVLDQDRLAGQAQAARP